LMLLCILNIYISPFPNRGWVLMFRPLAGFWILATLTEITFKAYGKRWFPAILGTLSFVILLMGIGALNWTGKASRFEEITALLPQWQSFWWWRGGLNVNEYAGGATWLLPTLAGLALR